MARRQLLKLSGMGLTLALGVATGAVTSTSAASAAENVALKLVDYWGDEPAKTYWGELYAACGKQVGATVSVESEPGNFLVPKLVGVDRETGILVSATTIVAVERPHVLNVLLRRSSTFHERRCRHYAALWASEQRTLDPVHEGADVLVLLVDSLLTCSGASVSRGRRGGYRE